MAYIGDVQDHSMVLYYGDDICAVWPLFTYQQGGQWQLASTGRASVLPPLFTAGTSVNQRKKITQYCIEYTNKLAFDKQIKRWSAMRLAHDIILDSWHKQLMESAAILSARHCLYLDVTQSLEIIWGGFRSSYKSPLKRAEERWQTRIIDKPNQAEIERFRQLHITVAGKETRSEHSWELQRKLCCDDNGFLVFIEEENALIGASLFIHSDTECYYGVGAYDRDKFDQPVSHLAQWLAIQECQHRHIGCYRIGERPYAQDAFENSKKSSK